MELISKSQSRKKFVQWGLGILSSFTIFKLAGYRATKTQDREVKILKMLGEDGKLVEVLQSTLPANRKKITDTELQKWVKK